MRQSLVLCLALIAMVPQRQCDFASPDKLNAQIQNALQPYFANAKGEAIPKQAALVGYTCVYGAGPQLPAKIAQAIAADPDQMRTLKMIPYAPLVGGANYNFLILAFDNGVVRYDTHTHEFATFPPNEGYMEHYQQVCGVPGR